MKNNISSNRSFGLVFSIFFFIIFSYNFFLNNDFNIYILLLSIIFLILGVLNSKILYPMNRVWIYFGYLLGKFITPVVLFILYFSIVLPTNLVLKIIGKDIMRLKYNKNTKSYWELRDKKPNSMDNQF